MLGGENTSAGPGDTSGEGVVAVTGTVRVSGASLSATRERDGGGATSRGNGDNREEEFESLQDRIPEESG